jgi:hypothetical protein
LFFISWTSSPIKNNKEEMSVPIVWFLVLDFLLITGLGPKVFESVLAHLVFFWAPITCDKEIKEIQGAIGTQRIFNSLPLLSCSTLVLFY